ncbi:hypothetical protein D9615_009532 [Tricholomella constricta]|uniref:Gag-like protein n=1 Tax=Tricholomella constricta TaxID=117010 RepID=A0A8H5GV75_9AGAR|nr:hypothetical protein D9615_009532 [Tricholomella constricta]
MALPGARGPPGSGRPSTRATSASSTTKISCREDARKWLEDNGHTMRPDELEAGDLKHAILSLSKTTGVPHEVTEGLRAIAFCIEDVEQTRVEEAIAAVVAKMWEELKEEVGVVAEASVKSVKEIGEDIRRRNEERDTREAEARPATNNAPRLYADMARPDARTTAAEAEHREVMGRGEIRDKQVLIDGRGEGSNDAIAGLTEKLLIEKAKMTLDLMGIGGLDAPRGIAFVAVRKLRNGGALYEMNSTEAATWLRGEDVKKLFVEKFGAEVELKDRSYPLLVEFVPTSLGDNAAEAVREIERVNGLGEGEVTQAKWVRAPHTRTNPNQKSAHLIVSCRTKETANKAIDKGLVIEGKRVAAKKLDQEPRRCLKCQFYGKGHIAQECKQIHETCGTCAGQHRSKDCKETDMRKLCCVNCRARRWRDNHSSADRLCPVFLEAKERLKSRMPELKYKFYPTNDVRTWARVEDSDASGGRRGGGGGGYGGGYGGVHGGGYGGHGGQGGGSNDEGYGRGGAEYGARDEQGWTYVGRTNTRHPAEGMGQGRLAGGEPGQGGGGPPREDQGSQRAGTQPPPTQGAMPGSQTSLMEYGWEYQGDRHGGPSQPSTQDRGREEGQKGDDRWWAQMNRDIEKC